MGLFKRYLDQEDKNELQKRQELINQYIHIASVLEQAKQSFFAGKFSKYGLDASKNWGVNPLTGQISEIKPEPKK